MRGHRLWADEYPALFIGFHCAQVYSKAASASLPEALSSDLGTLLAMSSKNAWILRGKVSPKSVIPDSVTTGPDDVPTSKSSGFAASSPPGARQNVIFSMQFSTQKVPRVPALRDSTSPLNRRWRLRVG